MLGKDTRLKSGVKVVRSAVPTNGMFLKSPPDLKLVQSAKLISSNNANLQLFPGVMHVDVPTGASIDRDVKTRESTFSDKPELELSKAVSLGQLHSPGVSSKHKLVLARRNASLLPPLSTAGNVYTSDKLVKKVSKGVRGSDICDLQRPQATKNGR